MEFRIALEKPEPKPQTSAPGHYCETCGSELPSAPETFAPEPESIDDDTKDRLFAQALTKEHEHA